MTYMITDMKALASVPYNSEVYCVDGKCSGCGACCSNFLPVTDREIRNIKKYIARHAITPREHGFKAPLKNRTVDMVCPFRDDEKKCCTIYEVRPVICAAFKCDSTPEKVVNFIRKKYPNFNHRKANCINVRLTFFGGDDYEDQVAVSRLMAARNKALFGSDTGAWS